MSRTIKVSDEVYERIVKEMIPRETFSQCLGRLLEWWAKVDEQVLAYRESKRKESETHGPSSDL